MKTNLLSDLLGHAKLELRSARLVRPSGGQWVLFIRDNLAMVWVWKRWAEEEIGAQAELNALVGMLRKRGFAAAWVPVRRSRVDDLAETKQWPTRWYRSDLRYLGVAE